MKIFFSSTKRTKENYKFSLNYYYIKICNNRRNIKYGTWYLYDTIAMFTHSTIEGVILTQGQEEI